MSENNLFQFAELPIQNTAPKDNSNQKQQPNYNPHPRYLHIRKNACVVCSICFTCSKYNCNCPEIQPRRGKNLPEGGLDSRAKKLHRQDHDDFEFSIKWINENAHQIYKDENDTVLGLRELSEVSLCKAHSSTLYRAKKRHERSGMIIHPIPPLSPADSEQHNIPYHYPSTSIASSGVLAAKVREVSSSNYQPPQVSRMNDVPDFTKLSHSTSNKRKRLHQQQQLPNNKSSSSPILHNRPNSSTSTPLYGSLRNPFIQPPPPPSQAFHLSHSSNTAIANMSQQQQQDFQQQLPPLHSRGQQQQASQLAVQIYHSSPCTPLPSNSTITTPTNPATTTSSSSTNNKSQQLAIEPSRSKTTIAIETVSLRSFTDNMYYFRNLAITDNFTFRDLLAEIDMIGSPPPGKRIVISDAEKFYPFDQAIRSVIPRPNSNHLDLCLGLTDKPSINWSHYS